jgi:cardiolipin synthase (CMP-forming)
MLPLRLLKSTPRLAGLQKLCCSNTLPREFHQLTTRSRKLLDIHFSSSFYCTQIKKNDIAISTVKGTELLQEAIAKKKQELRENITIKTVKSTERLQEVIEKKKQQLHDKKQQIQENIRDTKTKVREKVIAIERENILTIPNALCIARIAMCPYLGYVIVQHDYSLAMGLMIAAGFTDLADGYIARNFKGQKSNFGSFLDPLADKCLMGTLVVALGYCELLPLWLAVTILFRDVFLIAAAFVIRYRSLPATHRNLTSYFDATQSTAQLAPTFISKVNTAVQLFVVAASLGAPVWDYVDHPALHGLWYLTGATTAAAAISYMVKKDTYKYIKKEMKRK